MKRRELLALGGMTVGAWLTGSTGSVEAGTSGESKEAFVWNYVPLDPAVTAQKAYDLYKDGSCMFATFRAIVESVGTIRSGEYPSEAEKWSSFPYFMMYYGKGGVHDYGSLCGVLNGCAAAISLFVPERKDSAALTTELFQFYETTPLPTFVPTESKFGEIPQTIAESVLCHVSVSRWTAEADEEAESPRRKERCKRLVGDGVIKTVELLNRYWENRIAGKGCVMTAILEPAASCVECHSPGGSRPDANVKMNCSVCHEDLDDDHGSSR